jgi:hypothetical protein
MKTLTILLLAIFTGSSAAWGGQIVVSPSNVIGAGETIGGTWNSEPYGATNIFDQQVGAVYDNIGNYWLCGGACSPAFITIDLGAAYQITSIDLFNSHNDGSGDRGTGNFYFVAGNSVLYDNVTAGDVLTGATNTILTGTLTASPADPITRETFAVSDTGFYRYLEFHATSGASWARTGMPALNEIRLFGSPIPEPAPFGLIGFSLTACLLATRRRVR